MDPGSHVGFQKQKSGRGLSNEHLWQVWLKSVQRFQRRRVKCEKLTDGRRMLTHDKSSHGLWTGELKSKDISLDICLDCQYNGWYRNFFKPKTSESN